MIPSPPQSTLETTASNHKAVSEQIMEFLLTEISSYAAQSSLAASTTPTPTTTAATTTNADPSATPLPTTSTQPALVVDDEESLTVAAEMAAAKLERMGASVGYRITERLAESKTWSVVHPTNNAATAPTSTAAGGGGGSNALPLDVTAAAVAAQQLEAVKFLCKDVWNEIFNKQIDKLQTNHRGVFVLKDLELKWLTRFPLGPEGSRVAAIRLLAFPCGVIRGALANLGIPAVVSCDFCADGHHMAQCSFNIKVK